jgi:hypothetical protein
MANQTDDPASFGLELELDDFPYPYFPVILWVCAVAEKTVETGDAPSDDRIKARRVLYTASVLVGKLNVETIRMAGEAKTPTTVTPEATKIDHPYADLRVVRGGFEIKLADIVPQKYGMVTAFFHISALTHKNDVVRMSESIFHDSQAVIETQMKRLAATLGGVTPFTNEEQAAAVAAASKETIEPS